MDATEAAKARQELRDLIANRADEARLIVALAPKTYDIRGGNNAFRQGWLIGFRRCLAELHRITEKIDKEKREDIQPVQQ